MKTKYFLIGTALCSLIGSSLTSCNNDKFLEVTQYEFTASSSLYENDENAKMGMNGVYDMMLPDGDEAGATNTGDWGFKPNLFTGCHPTMDTQATGWDKDWNVQNWNANSTELYNGWCHAYIGISRANDFLAGLETADRVSEGVKNTLTGEARAARAFFYHWLATTFGRVPMLATGETYSNTPTKARAKDYAEMWDFIIDDLTQAASLLDWKPMDGQYGRCTKGMALTYLGDAYMWKAYRCPDQKQACIQKAKEAFEQVINSGVYELNRSFSTLWDAAGVWGKEAIWEEVLDEGSNWGNWSGYTSRMWLVYYTACPENNGWGSLYLSWEWYSSFEKGDKRRDASACTGKIHNIDDYKAVDGSSLKSEYSYGYNPFNQVSLGNSIDKSKTYNFHFYNGEYAPSIWCTKYWRLDRGAWAGDNWTPAQIYWKRLANVYLDYAECLFILNGGDDATAWSYVDAIRNRAFGNLEVGHAEELTKQYLPNIQKLIKFYADNNVSGQKQTEEGVEPAIYSYNNTIPTQYPIPFNTETVPVKSAKEFYTWLKAEKGFNSEVWKVAVNEERRKEFNCEWSLRPDMQRSGYMEDHIAHNYPKRNNSDLTDIPWTNRSVDYNEQKMDMPIPQKELDRNSACDQNPGY